MAEGKKRRIILTSFVVVVSMVFVVFANTCSGGVLPAFLQKAVDRFNNNSGGLLYKTQEYGFEAHSIDVGQGDSELVRCNGRNMLIDGGVPDETGTVEDYLHAQGVQKLDYVVGTHPHDDHIGGLCQVISDFGVGHVILPDATNNSQTFHNLLYAISNKKLKITIAVPGMSYTLGGGVFKIIAPNAKYDDLNDMSVVIKFTYGHTSFLFTGDASKNSEEDILKKKYDIKCDVLKVGHHGSDTASTPEFLKAASPKYAVISAGAGNSYGLPDEDILERLQSFGIKTFCTYTNGTVIFKSNGNTITCFCEK